MTTIIEIGTAKAKPGTIEEGKIIVEKLSRWWRNCNTCNDYQWSK
jgi:hypothetical protein